MSHVLPALKDIKTMATQLRMPIGKLDRLLGSFWVFVGKTRYDVGLSLHDRKNSMVVLDYSVERDGQWQYTDLVAAAVREYKRNFPWIFTLLDSNSNELAAVLENVSAEEQERQLSGVRRWLKEQPFGKRKLVPAATKVGWWRQGLGVGPGGIVGRWDLHWR